MMQRVADGISIETVLEDAMSKESKATISFPPYGPFSAIEDIASALENLRGETPRTLAQAKQFVETKLQGIASERLSAEKFYPNALRLIDQVEDAVAQMPEPHLAAILAALNWAFAAGVAVTTGQMRERHLEDVTREAAMKRHRSNRLGKLGKTKDDSDELFAFMDIRVVNGMTIRNAARLAFERRLPAGASLGKNLRANVERYRYMRKKRQSAETDRSSEVTCHQGWQK